MKRVFLYAYDHVNLGDDLFIRTIAQRYPHVKFYLWSNKKNKAVFSGDKNVKIIDRNSFFCKALQKIRPSLAARYENWFKKRSNAVVYIGGSIFIEYPTWRSMLNWWNYQAENYPFYLIGANFGPYEHEEYRAEMEVVFRKSKDTCFRDRFSHELFSPSPNIRLAPDILFSYQPAENQKVKKQIFVSVIDCTSKDEGQNRLKEYEESYILKMSEMIAGYLKDGYQVVLASFCEEEGDPRAIERLCRCRNVKAFEKQLTILLYDGTNAGKLMAAMGTSEYIIASRFHAVVLSAVVQRPVFPVIYSSKTKNILLDLGFQGESIAVCDINRLDYEFSRKNLDHNTMIPIEKARGDAQGHFEILDKAL